jgi:phenylpropionate dioxygenase-like ring-hydroxylating dioxygenase large terminal subunit
MWMKTWQMACREEQIPNVGDFYVYDIVGKSLIIVRTGPDEIKALYNSCTHRGRKLVTQGGCRKEFKCPYHGFRWKNDGTFLENPLPWDFKHVSDEQLALPEARCGRWGGFVFVNFDDNAAPLEETLGPIPAISSAGTYRSATFRDMPSSDAVQLDGRDGSLYGILAFDRNAPADHQGIGRL